jgi:hypothetical protein
MVERGRKFVRHCALAIVVGVCSTIGAHAQNASRCPPPGTEVPFAKVTNEAFVETYQGCDIITRAAFFVPRGKSNYDWSRIRPAGVLKDKVPFQAVPPGEAATASEPLLGVLPHVWISRADADIIFGLKRGDPIVLRGGTAVSSRQPALEFVFIATQVTKGN